MKRSTYTPKHLAPRRRRPLAVPAASAVALAALALAPTAAAQDATTTTAGAAETTTVVRAAETRSGDTDPAPAEPTPVDPVPADPVPTDPVPSDPEPTDPVPDPPSDGDADPVPSDPTDEAPSDPSHQPTNPDAGSPDTDPADPGTGEADEGTGGGSVTEPPASSHEPGKPLAPGTVVDAGSTPVTAVTAPVAAGAQAPAGHTWVVKDSKRNAYVAVAGYEDGAMLAQTGVNAELWAALAAGLVAVGGGALVARRRLNAVPAGLGRHVA